MNETVNKKIMIRISAMIIDWYFAGNDIFHLKEEHGKNTYLLEIYSNH